MYLLGIETSCDETAAAVVQDGRQILSNVIFSQIELHRKTGGVVPEVAAREHVVRIVPVIEEALKKAKVQLRDIDAIAVTAGPGLLSSLLIGVNAAMTLALVHKKPLIPVNHIEGHMYANWLSLSLRGGRRPPKQSSAKAPSRANGEGSQIDCFADARNGTPKFPIAVLTASGGHNELVLWKRHGEYKFLGTTLDDAAGEAFDKVARMLGLPYPGGPQIQIAAVHGDPKKFPLPRPHMRGFNFSFSGLKTAVLYLLKEHGVLANSLVIASEAMQSDTKCHPEHIRFAQCKLREGSSRLLRRYAPRNDKLIADVAASFQESVCEVLATKLVNAAKKYRVKEVHLAGGVSANARLREWVTKLLRPFYDRGALDSLVRTRNDKVIRFCQDLSLCTDNAAMVASAGYFKFKKNPSLYKKWRPIIPDPNLRVKNWA